MPVKGLAKFQIGKNGITPGVIESLGLAFKTRKIVRVSVLKSAARDKERVKEMANEISENLGKKDKKHSYNYKVIGFTIIMKRAGKKKI